MKDWTIIDHTNELSGQPSIKRGSLAERLKEAQDEIQELKTIMKHGFRKRQRMAKLKHKSLVLDQTEFMK